MNTCETCRFWDDGCCDNFDWIMDKPSKAPPLMEIVVNVLDDSGLYLHMHTRPDFGCVQHEPRKEAEKVDD